jgi:hypothetical protein
MAQYLAQTLSSSSNIVFSAIVRQVQGKRDNGFTKLSRALFAASSLERLRPFACTSLSFEDSTGL